MKIVAKTGREDLAVVYIGEDDQGRRFEFVESLQPPIPREKKWVNIISVLYGCPAGCRFCDAGGAYAGENESEDLLFQTDSLVNLRWRDSHIRTEMWKIQFARMGDPAFNIHVLDVISIIPERYQVDCFFPSISTIAPQGCEPFFEKVLKLKQEQFPERFQFQFSLHSTDPGIRRHLIPLKTWSFKEMAAWGEKFGRSGGRKITLNFILAEGVPVLPEALMDIFDPDFYLVKLTPLNPTWQAQKNGMKTAIKSIEDALPTTESFNRCGYETIISLGEFEENAIGSNCGQYVSTLNRQAESVLPDAYQYENNRLI